MPVSQTDFDLSSYYSAFYPAALAYGYALVRYPDIPHPEWQAGFALNLARAGDPLAAQAYALAATHALNTRAAVLGNLADWFHIRQSELTFTMHTLTPLPGDTDSAILAIGGGGSAFLLVRLKDGRANVTPLTSQLDLTQSVASHFYQDDLNGDGMDEVMLWQEASKGGTQFWLPTVFDLSQDPPKTMPFNPIETIPFGLEYTADWKAGNLENGETGLILDIAAFPPCPLNIHREYHWDGQYFNIVSTNYTIQPLKEYMGYCELLAGHASQYWDLDASTQIREQMQPFWPPVALPDGSTPPLDAKEEFAFRLGIAHALQGKQDQAVQEIRSVVPQTINVVNRWAEPAKEFLDVYRKPEDIYRACVVTEACSTRQALKSLEKFLAVGAANNLIDIMAGFGVYVRATGTYDFDGDATAERWFTVAPRPTSKLEFWIISETNQTPQLVFVSTINANLPKPETLPSSQSPAPIRLDEFTVFQLLRVPETRQIYVDILPADYFWDSYVPDILWKSSKSLFISGAPAQAHQELSSLLIDEQFACTTERIQCARFYALYALAAELDGDENEAVKNLLKIWRRYPDTSFALFTRLKLMHSTLFPTSTPKPTYTPTLPPQ